jgi:lysophospholipase L1-like esterase
LRLGKTNGRSSARATPIAHHQFNDARGVRDARALLAADHTHPNSQGHVVIARLLTQYGVTPLHR